MKHFKVTFTTFFFLQKQYLLLVGHLEYTDKHKEKQIPQEAASQRYPCFLYSIPSFLLHIDFFFNKFIYVFIFGCIGSSLLCVGFL